MIKNINITGVKYELNDTTKRYIEKKIGALDRFFTAPCSQVGYCRCEN